MLSQVPFAMIFVSGGTGDIVCKIIWNGSVFLRHRVVLPIFDCLFLALRVVLWYDLNEVIPVDWNYQVGNFICQLRNKKGLTQKELGERLGVSNKAVSKWENGAALPRVSLIPKLADELGCTQEELFLGVRKSVTQREGSGTLTEEYLTVMKRCDCCRHDVRISRKKMTCSKCGATLKETRKTKAHMFFVTALIVFPVWVAFSYYFTVLTSAILATGFPSAEEAALHEKLMGHFPYLKQLVLLAGMQLFTIGALLIGVLWYFIAYKLVLRRASFRIVKYPHVEDGKIVL